jgi:hypothetical protein
MSRSPEEEAYGDAVYRAWRSGMNPDRVSRNRISDTIHDYSDPWDCASAELRRLRRQDEERRAAEEEDEY